MVELDLVKRINEFLSDYDNVEELDCYSSSDYLVEAISLLSEALNYIEYND